MKKRYILNLLLIFFTLTFIESCGVKNSPPIINDQNFSLNENSLVGTFVGNVIAFDADNDTLLTYSITGGNIDNSFIIDENNGEISVLNEDALDYETTPIFTLEVQVKDSEDDVSLANVTVYLINIDPPTNGLILYLPFDGTLDDLSTENNDGIDHTNGNFVDGVKSQALDFNGTTDYIELTNTLNSTNGLSFSFWLKSRGAVGTENNGTIICKYSMNYDHRSFALFSFGAYDTRSENRLTSVFYPYGNKTSPSDLLVSDLDQIDISELENPLLWSAPNSQSILLNTWMHCIVNVTYTSIEIWINGELCTTKQREFSTYFNSYSEPTYIGNNLSSGAGTNNHFNGLIDEFRVYNRTFSDFEIRTLFKE